MIRALLWYVAGAVLIGAGVYGVCGDLIAGVGHWPTGVAVATLGVWVLVRAIGVRREFLEARK